MEDVSRIINAQEISISKSDIEEAFEKTEVSLDSDNYEHRYSPWHFIEFNGERKPINDVFWNIQGVQNVAKSKDDIHSIQEVFEKLGFKLYNRKSNAETILRDTFEEILDQYPNRQGTASKDKRLYQLLVNKAPNFLKHIASKNFDKKIFEYKGTAGQGNWPNIPWVAAMHPKETSTTQKGIYIVYLIDPEKETIYVTLNQGTTEVTNDHTKPEAREILETRAEEIREKISLEGFSSENPNLSDNDKLYEESTIYQKKYNLGNLPEPEDIGKDFLELAEAYLDYLRIKDDLEYPEAESKNNESTIRDFDEKEKNYKLHETEIDIEEDISTELDLNFENLYFPEEVEESIRSQIIASLRSGKNIIFTGPPGTGKTEIAESVARELKEKENNITSYELTTATADWSTFDTVGGFMPEKEGDGDLEFNSGQILKRFKDDEKQLKNEALVIDEINRSDIDKAFGQLFTVLSGQKVQLPYTADNGREIEVIPGKHGDATENPQENQYIVPESWRILATMNSYDKTSLYEMSYAFMRRFAFIRVDAPDNKFEKHLREYNKLWEIEISENSDAIEAVADIWDKTNSQGGRKLGPAIAKDMLGFIAESHSEDAETNAVINFVFPQLEGVRENGDIVREIAKSGYVKSNQLRDVARDMLQVKFNEDK